MEGVNWTVLVISEIIVFLIAAVGSIFTSKNTRSKWYDKIKPKITPPGFVFPIVWTILYFLIGLSLYFAWISGQERGVIGGIFAINLFLNVVWSYLFFYRKNVKAGFIEIIFLWISILVIIILLWKISVISSILLIPYFLWVSFASYLNYLIVSR